MAATLTRMTFLERYSAAVPTANPASLQLLFRDLLDLSRDALLVAIREYHPTLANASVEFAAGTLLANNSSSLVGLVEWAEHVVKLFVFDEKMPANAVEGCLRPALLPPDIKDAARQHGAHILLYYAGKNDIALEQLVALGCVAGALAQFGGIVTLNEEARAAIASFALTPDDAGEDMIETLRTLPVPYLYGGFAKMELTEVPGVWIRTFACPRIGLPNLAYHAASHAEGERLFHLFTGILGYLRETGFPLESGEVVRIDDTTSLRVREAENKEWWLDSDGPLWVLEPVAET
jgi:hypothetical protein